MIKLSKRLETVASFVLKDNNSKIIDVGCDHALLDIYLLQNNNELKVIASDNKEEPLKNAKKNIAKYSFLDKIEITLREGIHNIPKEIDTVIISGMGAETIIEILKQDEKELNHINRLIISSNNKYEKIREEITKLGYIINDEKIVLEDKYYIVIEFVKKRKKYTKKELFFGPILLKNKDKLFIEYYNYIKNKNIEVLSKIPKTNSNYKKIEKEINTIDEELLL